MRWLELLAFADGDPVGQQRVLDTALALLHQVEASHLPGCVVSSAATVRSLCRSLDDFGITVSDDLAQELGIVSLGVEAAWLCAQPMGAGADQPTTFGVHLRPSTG
jgi:hypothetical protein